MSRSRFFGTALLVIAACAALSAMQRTTPNYTRLLAPIESQGDAGSLVRGRTIALRVDGVEVARKLQGHCYDGARTFDSQGVWVIVHATATAVTRPEMLAATAIETPAGTRYLQSERPGTCGNLLSTVTLQPDVPTQGDLVFELPDAGLAGAELLAASSMFGLAPLDSQLRIGLGLQSASALQVNDLYELRKR